MDLILWRHAEAEDAAATADDLERALTARGEKQAARVAAWLDRQLPEATRLISSPARRCEQTMLALGRKYRVRQELSPEGTVASLLQAVQWPSSKHAVLVCGHQPTLGAVVAHLLGVEKGLCPVRKGAVWWLRTRERDGARQTLVVAVQSSDTV